jgi:hypothetical protein
VDDGLKETKIQPLGVNDEVEEDDDLYAKLEYRMIS